MLHSRRLLSSNYCTAVNPIIGRNLTLAKKKQKTLTSELRVPVTQGLLLGRSEVRKVIVLILQCFLIQAKGGKASGCISSSKDSIRPLFKNKTKPKTNCLLVNFSVAQTQKMASLPMSMKSPFLNIEFHLETISD